MLLRGVVLSEVSTSVSMFTETSQLQPLCSEASRHLFVTVNEQMLALAVDTIIGKETTLEPLLTSCDIYQLR